jgi:hypothetical protein
MNEICPEIPNEIQQNKFLLKTTGGRQLTKIILVIGLCLTVYVPAMRAGFAWDDDAMLVHNLVLRENGLYKCWFTTQQSNYWPITWTSYWLENKLWGLRPGGYHITNIFIHIICSLLVWYILVRLKVPAAFAAAIIFAAHPVNVESVAWITQRKTILAMMFFLLSLLCYLRFDSNGRKYFYLPAVALFAAAMLSKGSVAAAPVVILLCVWWLREKITKKDILRSVPFFAVSAVMSVVEIWFQYFRAMGQSEVRGDSFSARLAGAGAAVWFYVYKAIFPTGLIIVYPRWVIDPACWAWYVPVVMLAGVFLAGWRRRHSWGRGLLFAAGYYAVMLAPMLGFFDIYFMRYSFVADHYQYSSIAGLTGFAAAVCYSFFSRFGTRGVNFAKAVLVLVLLIFSALSWRQCHIYKDNETLWTDMLQKRPGYWLAYNNLGYTYLELGRWKEATEAYKQEVKVRPDDAEAYCNLGFAYRQMGRQAETIEAYEQAGKVGSDNAEVYNNIGVAYSETGQQTKAIEAFKHAIKISPDFAEAHLNLGFAYLGIGDNASAEKQYEILKRLNLGFADRLGPVGK